MHFNNRLVFEMRFGALRRAKPPVRDAEELKILYLQRIVARPTMDCSKSLQLQSSSSESVIALLYHQNKILLISIACFFCCWQSGCKQHHPKSLPAPLLDDAEYELEGRVRRIWGADSFEFGEVNELHFIVIRGVDTPKPGQPYFDQAKEHLTQSVRHRIARISVVDRDPLMREFADVYSRPKTPDAVETNVGLDLIEKGLGWYDGTEFEDADVFKQAELGAREKRIGLWVQDNPIPPWEFEEH